MKKNILRLIPYIVIILVIFLGAVIFREKNYAFISLCVLVLACVPFIVSFERKRTDVKKLVLMAVMTALAVVGRILFAALPGFKPVSAIVIITALYLGGEAGFMTGAASALISNFYFGQGPWTPFQMCAFGLIGLFAGVFSRPFRKNTLALYTYAAITGIAYSLFLDLWTVIYTYGEINLAYYEALVIASLTFTIEYAVSNVVFLLFLEKPIGRILNRVKTKYGIT